MLGGGWLAFILLRKNLLAVTGHYLELRRWGRFRVSDAGANCYVLRIDH